MSKNKFHHAESKPHETKWWSFKMEEVWERVHSGEHGLQSEEVAKRQEKSGPNQLPSKESEGPLNILFIQIKSPLVIVLVVASIISLLLGDFTNAGVIFLALLINVIVGFWQELKSSRALEALQKIIISYAKVLRNEKEHLVKTEDLVPGDVVLLSPGDKVPADLRLFKINDLKINEAVLTGESVPRDKTNQQLPRETVLADRTNLAFMGTIVTQGHSQGVVIATGKQTSIGKIAQLVAGIQETATPLQQKLGRFALFLTKLTIAIALFIMIFGLVYDHSFQEMFTTAVAVAVAAIPEGLAVTVTVVLAVGMQRILKKNSLVKHLLGAEILGSTNVICADKTGTITEGKMHVVKIVTENINLDFNKNFDPAVADQTNFLLRIGLLCNNAHVLEREDKLGSQKISGNLTEQALLLAGQSIGLNKNKLDKRYSRLDEIPFNSHYKFMMTLHKFDNQHHIVYLKGAPEKVLLFSNHIYSHDIHDHLEMTPSRREKYIKIYEDMSKQGLRVLALGYKKVGEHIKQISDSGGDSSSKQAISELYTNFVFVGFVGIKDPIRDQVKETIIANKSAGISTVMITGDNKFTAKVIAEEIGLKIDHKNIIEGEELNSLSEQDLRERVKDIKVYARTTPEQKLKIVSAWQERGAVVAMTGDGINDAPALKQADIGVALGTATDVAKEASDLILLNNNFKTIVDAVRQGRLIFANIKKIVLYYLSDSLTEVIVLISALICHWPLPFLASQIIWVNLIDDTFPSLALTQDPESHNLMQDKPVERQREILDNKNKILILFTSLITALFIIFSFWLFWQNTENNFTLASTIAFAALGTDSLIYIFSLRDTKKAVWKTRWWNNRFLIFGVLLGFFLQIIAIYNPFLQKIFQTAPLAVWHWIYIILGGFLITLLVELMKWILYHKEK